MTTIIELPWERPPLTGNRTRGNPQARNREVQLALTEARWAIRAAHPKPRDTANVTLHFRPATKHRRDSDGMFPTLKITQDALVKEGVIPDDSFVHVPRAACWIHPPTTEQPAMWVELSEIGDAA